MKKVFCCLGLICLLLTGCIKYEVDMEIKKNKSMDFSIIYLVAENMEDYSDSSTGTSEAEENLKKQGFTVTEYSEEDLKGIKAIKKINNIDKVSGNKIVSVNLNNVLAENYDASNLFKVEKGFFSNKYSAKFLFDLTDEEATEDVSMYSNYVKFVYKLVLPDKSISNNASDVSKDGKTLTWNATYGTVNDINFEFTIPNTTNVIIIFSSIIGVVAILIFLIINKKKKNKNIVNSENVEVLDTTSYNNII